MINTHNLGGSILHAANPEGRLSPRLVTAAHQFEASLMQELVKPLNSDPLFGDREASGSSLSSTDGERSALLSFGSEALAKALSEKGGLGIARKVLGHFEHLAATAVPLAGSNSEGGVQSPPSVLLPLLK